MELKKNFKKMGLLRFPFTVHYIKKYRDTMWYILGTP